MIDVNDLMKDDTQEIEISNGILVQVKCKLSILDQQTIMWGYQWAKDDLESSLKMAFWLIKSWNLTDGDEPLEVTFDNFAALPINFNDVTKIIQTSGLLNMNAAQEKKNIEES